MRIVVDVDAELHRALKLKAVQDGTSISEVIRKLSESYVAKVGYTATESHMDGKVRVIDSAKLTSVSLRPRMDLSKTAQAKGKMGHR